MRRQRNTAQMKEHEEEIGKLPGKEFRIMVVKIRNLEDKLELTVAQIISSS